MPAFTSIAGKKSIRAHLPTMADGDGSLLSEISSIPGYETMILQVCGKKRKEVKKPAPAVPGSVAVHGVSTGDLQADSRIVPATNDQPKIKQKSEKQCVDKTRGGSPENWERSARLMLDCAQ